MDPFINQQRSALPELIPGLFSAQGLFINVCMGIYRWKLMEAWAYPDKHWQNQHQTSIVMSLQISHL